MDDFLLIMPAFLFVGALVFILKREVKKSNQREKDKNSLVLTVRVKVTERHLVIRNSNSVTALDVAADTLEGAVVFETEQGEKLEFTLVGKPYRDILDGDEGLLSYQGKTFIGFERSR